MLVDQALLNLLNGNENNMTAHSNEDIDSESFYNMRIVKLVELKFHF